MGRTKVKLAWVENRNSRMSSLKKRRLGLVKKARELSILCDTKSCLVMYSPNEAEPMVWPSVEECRDMLLEFFALPLIEQKRKETSLHSYLTEKTKKVQEQLMTIQKKKMEHEMDQVIAQLQHGRGFADLNPNEIYNLLSFTKDKIMHLRKRVPSVEHPPLRGHPFEARSDEFRTQDHHE